jgi:hypothetical protein
MWDLCTGALLWKQDMAKKDCNLVAIAPDLSVVACATRSGATVPGEKCPVIQLLDGRTGEWVRELHLDWRPARAMCFTPDRKRLVVGGGGLHNPQGRFTEVRDARSLALFDVTTGVRLFNWSPCPNWLREDEAP